MGASAAIAVNQADNGPSTGAPVVMTHIYPLLHHATVTNQRADSRLVFKLPLGLVTLPFESKKNIYGKRKGMFWVR